MRKGGYRRAAPEYGNCYDNTYRTNPSPTRRSQPTYMGSAMGSDNSIPLLELNPGDMIQHAAFGRGMVLSVMKMGGDALLEIAFDDIGTKKLMAKTASAHMKKL